MSPGDFSHVAYHTVYKTDDVAVELEELRRPCDGAAMLILHAHCARWTPRIFREGLTFWRQFRPTVPSNIFAYPLTHDARWEKFVSLFGFTPLISAAPCNDGTTRPIWINYARPQQHSEHLSE